MFQNIDDYIKLPREKRREHLDLNEECIMIGGSTSVQYKGLLAHFLKTTIPHGFKSKVYLCHACNKSGCSNPKHLYWGTPQDNHIDQVESGTWINLSERTKAKYGDEKFREMRSIAGSKNKRGGGQNKLSVEQLKEWEDAISSIDVESFGWVQTLAKKMNRSHTQVRRIVKKYFPQIQTFQRAQRESNSPLYSDSVLL